MVKQNNRAINAVASNRVVTTQRPALAIVSNVPTPYRTHLYRRFATEIPEYKLYSIFTRAATDFSWSIKMPPEINPVDFSEGYGITSESPLRYPLRDWFKAGRIIRWTRAHNIRAMIINGFGDLISLRLIWYCYRSRTPVFGRADANIKGDKRTGFQLWLRRLRLGWMIRHCNGVMPMHDFGQQFFEKYGADPKRCFWVPVEPDYEMFSHADRDELETFRAERGLSPEHRYLLFSGRLIQLKRVDLLIDAFARLADSWPQWDLLIAGDGPLRTDVERRVPDALKRRVKWLGFCEVDQLRLAYHAAHILVLPSDRDNCPLVVNEAMAAGLPVVASNVVGSACAIVDDGVSGKFFEVGNLDSLTEALAEVMADTKYNSYRNAVGQALAAWRTKADPVAGLRKALRFVNLLP